MLEINKIYQMDCLEGMKQIPDESVDLVVTDPPYFIENLKEDKKLTSIRGQNYNPETGKTNISISKNSVFYNEFDHYENLDAFKEFIFKVLNEIDRVLKNKGQVYMFMSYHHLNWMLDYIKEHFRFYKPLIWYKPDIMGVFPNQYGCNYEVILWFRTNKKGINKFINNIGNSQRDVFTHYSANGAYRKEAGYHPTPKPIKIIRQFILNGSNEGSLVLDPFMGSGTTAVACQQTKRNYIGFEINKDYIQICEKRLAQKTIMETLEEWET